jgi:hypothetical protein
LQACDTAVPSGYSCNPSFEVACRLRSSRPSGRFLSTGKAAKVHKINTNDIPAKKAGPAEVVSARPADDFLPGRSRRAPTKLRAASARFAVANQTAGVNLSRLRPPARRQSRRDGLPFPVPFRSKPRRCGWRYAKHPRPSRRCTSWPDRRESVPAWRP